MHEFDNHRQEQGMTTVATSTDHTIDSILDQLDRFHQRATYGAVAGVVGSSARSLMSGRQRNQRASWIVNRRDGKPSGYELGDTHPDIEERERIFATPDELRSWLAEPD